MARRTGFDSYPDIGTASSTRIASWATLGPDFSSAFRIFSVLNDRGLELAPTDILKAPIIGDISDENRETYTKRWEDTEEDLGRDAFLELFSHIRMIHKKTKLRRTLVDEMRDDVIPKFSSTDFIDKEVVPLAEAMETLHKAEYEASSGADDVNEVIRHLQLIDNVDWLPPAMAYFRKHQHKPPELGRFLRDLERLAASMMVRREYANSRINRYARLLQWIEKDGEPHADESPLQLSQEEKKGTLDALGRDIYSQAKLRRPLLLRLDRLLTDPGATYKYKTLTVEHVLPQSPSNDSEWIKAFPDEDVRWSWTNRLANLVLLSQASNFDFARKKREYFSQGNTASFALTNQVLNEPEWTPAVLERRQKNLVDRLATEWRLR